MARQKKWKNPEELIRQIPKSQKPINRKKSIYTGVNTGMNFTTWLSHIFHFNERQDQKNRFTDLQIIQALFEEFPARMKVIRDLKMKPATFGRHRSRFNKLEKPQLVSLRYSTDGFPVHHYNHASNLSRIRTKCFIWGIIDPRFFTLEEIEYVLDMRQEGDDYYLKCRLPSEDTVEEHPYGSVKLGVSDPNPIPISELELKWFSK